MSTTTKNVGRVSIVPKGDWNINNTYIRLDLVTYDGNSYIAKKDVPKNIQLNNNGYWMLIASKGEQGERGEQGAPFAIVKSYASIAAMNADFSNTDVQNGQFVIIDTGNVQDPDNAKLYYKGSNNYVFVTDMSGAAGIQGPRGASAYEQAVAGGYEGTEAQFNEDLADFKELSEQAASSATAADNSAKDAEAYAIGKRGGTDVESTDLTYHNNAKYYSEQTALIVDDVEQVMTSTTIGPTAFATFDASVASMPLKGLTVDIEPVQDFNGYSRPWLGGTGKNQLSLSMSDLQEKNTTGTWTNNSYALNGVTFEVQLNNDNDVIGINVNGTASTNTNFLFIERAPLSGYPIIENGCPSGGNNSEYRITARVYYSSYGSTDYYDYGSGLRLSNSDGQPQFFSSWITIFSGYTASNLIFRPMTRLQYNSDDETFEPYSNICPITGWTGCKLHHTGVSLIGGDEFIGNAFVKNDGHYEITLGGSGLGSRGSGYVDITGLPAGQYTIECINYTSTAEDLALNFRYKKADGTYSNGQGVINSTYHGKHTITLPAGATLFQIYILPDTSLIGNKFIMDDIVIRRADEASELYNGNIYDITFPTEVGTVYGGTLDVVNKKLIVAKKYALLNDPDKWSIIGSRIIQYSDEFPDRKRYRTFLEGFLCSCADTSSGPGLRARWISTNVDQFGFSIILSNKDEDILDKIKTAAADNKIAILYDLAEPLVYDITTEQVATLLGENNIWTNIGDVTVTYGAYLETIKTYADQAVDSAAAAEDAQEAAEAVLASIPSDYTELSGDVDDLKSALSVQNDVSVRWELGTIDTNDGGDEVSTTRARSTGYINKQNRTLFINVPDGLRCSIRYFSEEQESGYVKQNVNPLPTVWNTGTVILNADQPDYARIVISYTDNRPINAEAGNSFSIISDGVVNAQDMQNDLKDTIESVSSVTNELHVAPKAFLKWVRGSIDTYNGTNVSSNNRIRSQYIQYDTSCAIIISDDMKYSYRTYKRDGTYIGSSGWIEHGGELLLNDDVASVRFVCAYINDADILPDDVFVFDVQFSQDRQGYSITKNESATGNITIRAAKTIMCNDGTPPLIDWYLLQTVNNQFYRSKDLRSKEYLFTFTPPTGDVASWSAGITATNDIIFVANAAGLSDTAGRLNDSNRVNPVCYLASEDYSVMHVVDFGTSLKPCGWLGNVGYCVLPNGNAVFCEYTRGTVKTANVWTITGDATEPNNWRTRWSTDIIDDTGVTAAGIKHCHEMQYDFYTGVLYMGTGDSPTGSFNYYSTDNGATWSLLYGSDKNRCRRLTFAFTKEKVYWASDSFEADYHHFFIADRNSAGLIDVANAQEVSLISNNSQACYGCVYLKSLNAIVMMDRVDGNGSDHLDWYCYDIDSGTVKLIGSINAANGSGGIFPGFRCTFVDWYPVENAIQTGFNPEPSPIQPDTNQNALCGNIIGRGYCGVGRINNLTLFVYKNGNNYSYRANTIIV